MERRVGAYALQREIGRGGAGVVWEGLAPEGPVAIKFLPRLGEERRARFDRERRLHAQLSLSDGFVPVLEVGESSAGPYLVMPLLRGGTLRDRLARGPLPPEEVLELGIHLAEALARAHALGIVHRDIKPENVLFGPGGAPLLSDFGLAKHFDPEAAGASQSVSLSRGGDMRGTAGYMAPEQVADAKTVGPAADVFALGAILWECLAGYPAFAGQNVVEVLRRVAAGLRDDLRQVRPDAPPGLVAVIEQALAADPAHRPRDGAALAAALRAWDRPPSRRRRRLLAGGLVLLLGGSVAGSIAWQRGAERAARLARLEALQEEVEERSSRGDSAGAVEACTRLLELQPQLAPAWFNRGFLRSKLGDRDGAQADFTRAIELGMASPAPHYCRGVLRGLLGDREGARADYERAIELDPRHATSLCNLGILCREAEDLGGARARFDQAIAADPRLIEAWINRAELRAGTGDRQGALADYDQVVLLEPARAMSWQRRGLVRARLDDLPGALADHSRAIELDPACLDAWISRGLLRVQLGDPAQGEADLLRAVELAPRHAETWHQLGTLASQLDALESAEERYSRAVELAPRYAESWLGRGIVRSQRGDTAGALADYTRAIELDPREGRAWCNRGLLKAEAGDPDAGLADVEQAVAVGLPEVQVQAARRRIAVLQRQRRR